MKTSFLLPLAVLASSAVAQSTTASVNACDADYIVERCLTTETAKLDACGGQDFNCRCAAWEAILTCYNNCPNDPRQHTDAGQREIFCGYASQYQSTTAATTTTTQSSASRTASTNAQATDDAEDNAEPTDTADESATSTSTGSSAANTNSGAELVLNAGSVLGAVAGVIAVVL
ncbi:hypothetical protein P885DRAFT_59820 [Corynascus similis CBS 632.67]